MSSKLDALKRYMSGPDPSEEKMKKKRKKKKTDGGLGMFVIDEQDPWETGTVNQSKGKDLWQNERNAYDEDLPTIVEGTDYDPESQPVVANVEEFLEQQRTEEIEREWKATEKNSKISIEDASPPRKSQRSDSTAQQKSFTGPRLKHTFDDVPPPRNSNREEASPERRNVDLSPPRRARGVQDDDSSPPRKQRRNRSSSTQRVSHPDSSPPRRHQTSPPSLKSKIKRSTSPHNATSTYRGASDHIQSSPSRRGKVDSDFSRRSRREDSSPPRRGMSARDSPRRSRRDDSSPPRRGKSDRDSPRRSRREDCSPPRRGKSNRNSPQRSRYEDSTPPRGLGQPSQEIPRYTHRTNRDRSPEDQKLHRDSTKSKFTDERKDSPPHTTSRRNESPPRHHVYRSSSRSPRRPKSPRRSKFDLSPQRSHTKSDQPCPRREQDKSPSNKIVSSPSKRELPKQEAVGGVFTGREFKEQQELYRSKQNAAFKDEELMGKQAETVYRDKRGRKLDMLMEMQRQQEIQDGKRKREKKEEYEWGTGKLRKEEIRSQQQEMEAIRAKPFARHNDDADLEAIRKSKQRDFDPIHSSLFKDDLEEKIKRAPKKNKKPLYSGPPPPPNRFNIRPGYRWDGIVRGINWEEKALLQVNARKAHKQDMYQWATADM